jgi:hypothetical protein
MTDIQDSTELSQQDPLAFRQVGPSATDQSTVVPLNALPCAAPSPNNPTPHPTHEPHPTPETLYYKMQEVHDSVMREAIARHGGYEIITEGDSFSIAFTTGGD